MSQRKINGVPGRDPGGVAASAAIFIARAVLDSVALPLAVVDPDLRLRAVNEALAAFTGLSQQDLERRNLLDLAGLLWGLEEPLRSHLEGWRNSAGLHVRFEFEHRTHGKSKSILRIRGRTLQLADEFYLLVTLDETTVAKADTADGSERSRNELRALADNLVTTHEDEHRRLARELHDDICQRLALLEIDTQQLAGKVMEQPDEALRELGQLQMRINALSEEVRNMSHALHPAAIDDLGVGPALRSLVEEFQERDLMSVTLIEGNIPENIPIAVATGLYRIAQEALRNVIKHAGKTQVTVRLTSWGRGIRLQVVDSGEGFDSRIRRSGLGIVSMEERARLIGGAFAIESKVGEGTRITVDVPIHQVARK